MQTELETSAETGAGDVQRLDHLRSAIAVVLNVDPGRIGRTTSLVADLGAESIDFIDISCEFEKRSDTPLSFKELLKARRARAGSVGNDVRVEEILQHLATRES